MSDIITDDDVQYETDIDDIITLALAIQRTIDSTRVQHPFAQRGLANAAGRARGLVSDLQAAQTWLPEVETSTDVT